MQLNSFQQKAFDEQRSHIEKFGRNSWGWTIFLLLWIIVGGYALYLQNGEGHIVTGMRHNVVWGLHPANVLFSTGISYAGAAISGILPILKVEWRKPIIRI